MTDAELSRRVEKAAEWMADKRGGKCGQVKSHHEFPIRRAPRDGGAVVPCLSEVRPCAPPGWVLAWPRRVRSGLPFGASTGNRLIANTVLGDGHYYDPEFERGDGIRVLSPDTFLSGNVANNFAGYGISAVEGVISGVNYASGNGNPAQCRNVICVPAGSHLPGPAGPAGPSGPAGSTGPGATPPAAADLTPPVASVAAKKRQRFGRTVNLTVAATSEDLWVSASGRLSIRGATKAYRLKAVTNRIVPNGGKLTLKLVLPVAARKAVRRALDHGRQVRVTLTLRVRDQVGNSSASKRTVTIKP